MKVNFIILLLGTAIFLGSTTSSIQAQQVFSTSDTLILKARKHKGYGLFIKHYSLSSLYSDFEKTECSEEMKKMIPKGISNPTYSQALIDFKPWKFEHLKKNYPEFLDRFLKDYYPSKIDTANIPSEMDNTVKVIVGEKDAKKVFIVDENNNMDFRDDPIRNLKPLQAKDWELARCQYKVYDGKKLVQDSAWVRIAEFNKDVLISAAQHMKSSFLLNGREYEVQVLNKAPYLRFCFDSPRISISVRNGIKKDSLLLSEMLEVGEYLKLGESFYQFYDVSNNGSTITLIKEKDISDKTGTQVGFLAPEIKGRTTEGDSVALEHFKGKYLLLVNLTACGAPTMSYEYYQELYSFYRSRVATIGIDISPLTLQTNIDELGLEGPFMIAKYNKSIKDNYREDYCSRICFLISPSGHVLDKFEIRDWKQALGKYFD